MVRRIVSWKEASALAGPVVEELLVGRDGFGAVEACSALVDAAAPSSLNMFSNCACISGYDMVRRVSSERDSSTYRLVQLAQQVCHAGLKLLGKVLLGQGRFVVVVGAGAGSRWWCWPCGHVWLFRFDIHRCEVIEHI
jgi:hypothetical protein